MRSNAPPGAVWVHEIKYDGYRLQLHIRGAQLRVLTRRDFDWSRRFPMLVEAARRLKVEQAILDGEVVVQSAHGE